MKEASWYIKKENKQVKCTLCPHHCVISDGKSGICGVRKNSGGSLYSETYGKLAAIALDPIEKKPLNQYKPGTQILSVGTFGCNFACRFCQNHHISKSRPETEEASVDTLLKISERETDSIGIAFTYNEPTIWYEYIYETAEKNPKDTVLVTNGFINPEPLNALLPYIDAMNIDLKSMRDDFYQKICGGSLAPVLNTIKTAYQQTHVELTFLAIPGYNDSDAEMEALAKWITTVDKTIPLHIIPFRPMYQMADVPAETMRRVDELTMIAGKYLNNIY